MVLAVGTDRVLPPSPQPPAPSPSPHWLAIVGPRETNLSWGLYFLPCQARSVVWNLFLGKYIIGLVMGSRYALLSSQFRKADPSSARVVGPFMR